ncbi:hypothetical protein SAMN05660461_1035 [Chitinophaga ginsengisegetis]|uniref:Uncharacterized protein n=1 Tax=Chitinophaga ginsengisegetis TaxID=393003 RepID=A0A1T5NBZ9_9BACT|nr:hypothetical protein [Chitinophaga ginsengisegetis]SKC97884.1 hypothetical protein SAMN05660461_1035 [Chitinophaga ginsengisegetis]
MDIYISEEAVVGDIQKRFREFYPYLRLAFYRNPHRTGECSPKEEAVPPETPIDKIRMIHNSGWLDVSYYRRAAAVEHDFSHEFGLSAQILRRCGDLWLETTTTDNWTLEELNIAGRPVERQRFRLPDEMEEE